MRPSGQTVINFLANNFAFLESLFKLSKNDNFFIPNEVLLNRCQAEGINISRLEEYGIVKPLRDGNYEFNKRFKDFIAFLIDDFRLDLPESIQKYKLAIETIYSQITLDNLSLNKKYNTTQINELVNGLINEIQEFSLQIDANTKQLFVETINISTNKDQIDYTERIRQATYLIENYIKPLNDILNKEFTDSFIRQLVKIGDFANLQRHELSEIILVNQFEKLYLQVLNISEEILKNSAIMAKDVTPLIDRLRTDSVILKGADLFLQNAKRGIVIGTLPFYELKGKRTRSVYASHFELSAKNLLELIQKQDPIVMAQIEEEIKIDQWIYNKDTYKEKLNEALPVDNFFDWCYKTLEKDTDNITAEKFYYIASLIFEKELQATFEIKEKFEIDLEDFILKVPYIKLETSENDD